MLAAKQRAKELRERGFLGFGKSAAYYRDLREKMAKAERAKKREAQRLKRERVARAKARKVKGTRERGSSQSPKGKRH